MLVLTQVAPAHAEEIDPSPKGIIGGGLLGAEVVMLGELPSHEIGLGVRHWRHRGRAAVRWPAHQDGPTQSQVSTARWRNGLVIPHGGGAAPLPAPPEDYTETGASGAPDPEPPRPGGVTPGAAAPVQRSPLALRYHWEPAKLKLPTGLLDLDEGAFKVAMPAVEIRPLYRLDEMQKYGLEQKHELRVPVFSATF
jgi:hypothetical protein